MLEFSKEDISTEMGLVRSIVKILDDRQAFDIKVIDVREQTSLCNYFILCSGRAKTHVASIADEVETVISKAGLSPLHKEGKDNSVWIALDYAYAIIHIFDKPTREFYCLEKLWRDGKKVDISEFLS